MSRSKQKGTAAETAIVQFLNEQGIEAVRNPPQGANDKGDINVFRAPVVIEVKNCKTMKLSEWMDEAEVEGQNADALISVVWHKRMRKGDPGEWYVTMSGESFTHVLDALSE